VVAQPEVGAKLQERGYRTRAAEPGGNHQRCPSRGVARVDVGAALDQEPDRLYRGAADSGEERRLPGILRRPVEKRWDRFLPGALVDVGAVVEQQSDGLQILLARELLEGVIVRSERRAQVLLAEGTHPRFRAAGAPAVRGFPCERFSARTDGVRERRPTKA